MITEKKIDLDLIFTGKVKIPVTNQEVHKFEKSQREGILCCLYNLVHELDLRMSIDDIRMFIGIYGNNIRTLIKQKRFTSKNRNLYINDSEHKLITYFMKEIIFNQSNNITTIADKEKQFEHLKEIRKWASMVYSIIHNKVLKSNPRKFKIMAYFDETSVTRIVLVDDDINKKEEIPVTWVNIKAKEIPTKLTEIKENLARTNQARSKQSSKEAEYKSYYLQAQEYITQQNYQQAEKLLKKIINSKEIFDFTSGAYVTLASIKINHEEEIKKDEIEALLNMALEINPNNKVAPAVFVILYILTGDYYQACKWLQQCKQETTKEVLEQNLEQLNQYFQYLLIPGQVVDLINNDDAMTFFTEALELFPDNIFIRLNAAKLYANREEEYLLKAYDLYKSIIDDLPNFFYPYQLIGDLCGAGYLERYKEQEEYYLKALKLLGESSNLNPELAQKEREIRFVIKENLVPCWLNLGKYEEVLSLTAKRIKENPNNTDIHNHAAALYFLERYQESIAYCQRELFVGEDESTYILLGKNFYALKDFDNAIMVLRKALAFIDQGELSTYYQDENNRGLLSFTKKSWQKKKLKEVLTLLLISYYRNKDFLNAKAIWKLANQNFSQDETIKAWGHSIDAMLEAQNQLELANEQYEKIKMELRKEKEEQAAKQKRVRQWALQLMKIQKEEPVDENMDGQYWETFEKQINQIVFKMCKEVDDKQGYAASKKTFAQRYPKLTKKSIRFLATAEYLFQHHKDSTIDFAPIMVEFCKVVENELRILLKQDNLTLGQAIQQIEQFKINPLIKELSKLKEIYLCRNGSAHTGVSTKEKVERIRELLIGSNSVLDAICQMK